MHEFFTRIDFFRLKKTGSFFIQKEKRPGCLFSFWITMTLVFCTLFFSKSRVLDFQKAGCPIFKNSVCRLTGRVSVSQPLGKYNLQCTFFQVPTLKIFWPFFMLYWLSETKKTKSAGKNLLKKADSKSRLKKCLPKIILKVSFP